MPGALAVILILLGAGLLHRGIRGDRVGSDLRCPNHLCNYPLRAIADANAQRRDWTIGAHHLPERPAFPLTCPECGRLIPAERDAARGEHRPNPALSWLGAALIAMGLGAGAYGWHAGRPAPQSPPAHTIPVP